MPVGRPAVRSMPALYGWPRPRRDVARPACAARRHAGDPEPGQSGRTGCRSEAPLPRPIPTPCGCAGATAGGLRLRVPDRSENLEHVGTRDLRDGTLPMRGKAYRSKVKIHSRPAVGVRQPACFCSMTRAAASAKLGTPCIRRFSASGSPPSRASLRLASAFSRASASETSATLPSPSSRRRPRMTRR